MGAVGALLVYPNNKIQHAGVIIGVGGVADHIHSGLDVEDAGYYGRAKLTQEISAITGACLLVSKSNFLAVGGLDEVNLPVAFNDVDFCLKLRERGLVNVYAPMAVLMHHESATRRLDISPEKAKRLASEVAYMKKRWRTNAFYDPYYNPNLSLRSICVVFTFLATSYLGCFWRVLTCTQISV